MVQCSSHRFNSYDTPGIYIHLIKDLVELIEFTDVLMVNNRGYLDMSESLLINEILNASHGLVISALKSALSVMGIPEAVYAYRYGSHAGIFEHLCNVFGNKSSI